jgi:hypothetical protein
VACHKENDHNAGGSPCPKRPGRVFKKAEALRYWSGEKCFCDANKRKETWFCDSCLGKLGPQARLDLRELANQPLLQAVAEAEKELMEYERREAVC